MQIGRIILAACLTIGTADATAADMLLLPDRVWTADGDASHSGWGVRVHDGAIAAVGPADTIDAPPATRIQLPGATLTPGLIDIHSHLFLHPYNETAWNDQVLKEPQDYRTLEAAQHARATLLAGFTTLRDLGTEGAGYADVSLKRAIAEGMIPGPRLFVATRHRRDGELRSGTERIPARSRASAGRAGDQRRRRGDPRRA